MIIFHSQNPTINFNEHPIYILDAGRMPGDNERILLKLSCNGNIEQFVFYSSDFNSPDGLSMSLDRARKGNKLKKFPIFCLLCENMHYVIRQLLVTFPINKCWIEYVKNVT